jgi:TonB family protein
MPKAEEVQVIVELTHHTVHVLRAVNGMTIEAGGECILENKPALEALLNAVVPAWKTDGLRADSVWPDSVAWHLSTDTEAFLDRTGTSLRTIATTIHGESRAAFAYAACDAGDGGAVTPDGTGKWILALSGRESLERVSSGVSGLKVEAGGARPAAFSRVGAVAGALRAAGKGSVALWDLGTERSHLLLVTANGVEAVAPCAAGMNAIFEAVQSALKLKFRGAGARLFFNEGYDFTEHGPKICGAVGASLKQALDTLPQLAGPPALACIGLTGKQAWFIRDTAAAAEISAWAPDLRRLAGDLGLRFTDDAAQASFSPASIGIFELLGSRLRSRVAWHPVWVEAEAVPDEDDGEAEEEFAQAEESGAAAAPVPAPSRPKPSLAPEGAPAPPPFAARAPREAAPGTGGAAPSGAPGAPPQSSRPPMPFSPTGLPPPPPPGTTPPFAAAAYLPPEPGAERPPSNPPYSIPTQGGPGATKPPPAVSLSFTKRAATAAPFPKRTATGAPFEGQGLKATEAAGPEAGELEEQEEEAPKSKVGLYVGIVAAAALVFAGLAFVVDAWMEKIKEHDLAQQEALAHHLAEVRLKDAELIAKAASEKSKKEADAAIASAQKKAEDSTRRTVLAEVEAERISKLPGILLVATTPPGASVSIDGAPPLTSPVRAEGIAPGAHRVRISLPEHETVEMNAEIKGTKTTDLGRIKLESSLGTLEVASSPDALEFVVHTADDPTGKPVRTGRTPASFPGITRGDYIVTFSRPGCHDHVEKVTVVRASTTPCVTKYLDGSLELTSEPSGAWVDKDGMRLGSTPLVLHDLTPKQASFELTLPGYDPTPITCEIPEGQTLKLTAELLRRDRIFKPSEVKTMPVSYESPQPELSPNQRKMGADVLISCVVQRDGSVVDVRVEKTTDDDIGRRCATAVARWKFRPGTASDDRAVDVRVEMPFKFPAANS